MRAIPAFVVFTLCAAPAAGAAEMTGAEIKEMLTGNTAYLELNPGGSAGGGRGVIYYNPDGKASFKTPNGANWDGAWVVKDNTMCIDWKQVPNNPCTRFEKADGAITLINVATGKPRGTLAKVEKGNPEKL